MSLIADSLKKAVQEKSVPKKDFDPEINLVPKRDSLKHPGLWSVFRVGLLIVLPGAILVYLISTGAFDFKKPEVAQNPESPVPNPVEKDKAPSVLGVPVETSKKAMPQTPPPESSSTPEEKKSSALEMQATPQEVVPSPGKEEGTAKKRLPSYPPKKKDGKKPESASLPATALKPEPSMIPKTLAKGSGDESLKRVPENAIPAQPAVEKAKVVDSNKPSSTVRPVEEKKPEAQTAKNAEIPAKLSGKEVLNIVPAEEASKTSPVEKAGELEKRADPPEVPSAVEPAEEKAPEPETAALVETPSLIGEPPIESAQPRSSDSVPSDVSDGTGEKSPRPVIEVQKEDRKVASLPSPVLKPKISRTDPATQENVFQNSDFYFNRAIFFQQARDWEKALENYVKAEKLDPNNPDTYNNKGVIFKEQGKYDKALDEFLRAIFLDPEYAKAYNNIGVVYFMQKNYAEGIRNYLKAIDLNPSNLEAFNNLAIIYKKQNDLEQARAVLNRALAMDPDHPGTNYNLAVLYEENREITPALHYYRRFIELGTIGYPSLVNQVKTHIKTLKPQ
ncbi:MAG: hypothetical protein NPINA01_26340 [Nitrospinaceae bacterium]|nr:MAG: hypothetical protein NPINA01_26340 [Nitrospinaceae bacterium]